MKRFLTVIIAITLGIGLCAAVSAQDVKKALPVDQSSTRTAVEGPVTALDVIQMTEAGLSDSVIINKIESSGAVFDLSVADIIELKKSGISDPVINHMINTKGAVSTRGVSSAIPKASPVTYVAPAKTVYVEPAPVVYYDYYEPAPVYVNFSYGGYYGRHYRGWGWGGGYGYRYRRGWGCW